MHRFLQSGISRFMDMGDFFHDGLIKTVLKQEGSVSLKLISPNHSEDTDGFRGE